MKSHRRSVTAGVLLMTVTAAGCSTATPAPAPAPIAATTRTIGALAGVLVTKPDLQLGSILFDGSDHAVYLFTSDTTEVSTCRIACSLIWEPLLAPATSGDGVESSKLSTATRADGLIQVTYAGHPLYEHAGDPLGRAAAEGKNAHWYAVSPAGDRA